ncbi:MAG: lytic transglycosylase domain-containing protein [Clostridia bacterium]|nr:lytic transglycosylase domain-containing protein [Clostridia bacterium]
MIYRWLKKIVLIIIILYLFSALINSAWFLKFSYPYPHREIITEAGGKYGVDPYLAAAIMRVESKFDARAVSRVGARGLMQIMPETGRWIAQQMKITEYTDELLFVPEFNLPMGIWYIAYLKDAFQNDTVKVLAAYNAGEHKVKGWLSAGVWTGLKQDIAQIPYAETRRYIDKVLFDHHIYKRVYIGEEDDERKIQ